MTETQAAAVVELAKGLFPVTKPERFDSLGLAILAFPDSDFAKKVLIELSHEVGVDKLDIPRVRSRLNAELHRRGQYRNDVLREADERNERRRRERKASQDSQAEVDEVLNDFGAEDLADLKSSTIKAMHADAQPFYEKLDPGKSVQLRAAMFGHLHGKANVYAS